MLEKFIEMVPSVNDAIAEHILMEILNENIKQQKKDKN